MPPPPSPPAVSLVAALAPLALASGMALLALAGALLLHRVLRERGLRALDARLEPARRCLGAWTSAPGAEMPAALAEFVRALRPLPRRDALSLLLHATDARLCAADGAALGAALRREAWVGRVLRDADARAWWRRLEAARLLALTGGPADAEALVRLLADPHVAVRAAATRALGAGAGPALAAGVVRALPAQPPALQRLQAGELRAHAGAAEAALIACLTPAEGEAPPATALRAWAGLAAALQRPRAAAALVRYRSDPDEAVRAAVAHALAACPSPAALRALGDQLADTAASVRAVAAQGTGRLGPVGLRFVAPLARCLADPDASVRLHAALALAQLGEPGRNELRAGRALDDRGARDTALFVAGLTDGAVLELAAA